MSIPLNIDWQQILLHLFNFAILAGGLYLLLYRPVKQFMEQRQARYERDHQEAEEARAQAAQVKDACQAKLAETDAAIAQKRAEAEPGAGGTASPADRRSQTGGQSHPGQSAGERAAGAG